MRNVKISTFVTCLRKIFYYNILLQIFHCQIEKTEETRVTCVQDILLVRLIQRVNRVKILSTGKVEPFRRL